METKINFKSIVVLGSFNPAILTPQFLAKHCGLSSEHEPQGSVSPIFSKMSIGDLQFTMELNKFQSIVEGISDFGDEYPVGIVDKYLSILEYTPLIACGINFNFTITDLYRKNLTSKLCDCLKVQEVFDRSLTSTSFHFIQANKTNLQISGLKFECEIDTDIKNTTELTFNDESLTVNNNFEIRELDSDRTKYRQLFFRYAELVGENSKLIKLTESI